MGSARLTVANTGPLLSAADAERIFEPFQQLNDRTSHSGFGLGLALVASIVEVHGGRVTATPRERGGLVVIVRIPLASPCADGREQPRDSGVSRPPAGRGA